MRELRKDEGRKEVRKERNTWGNQWREEGRKKGRKEGRKEGRKQLRKNTRESMKEGRKEERQIWFDMLCQWLNEWMNDQISRLGNKLTTLWAAWSIIQHNVWTFSCRPATGGATAPSATNLPTMEMRVQTNCTMSAEMERHEHSTETVWTDISGHFTAGSRLDLVPLYHTQIK